MSLLDHPIIDKIQAAKRRTVALRLGIGAEGNLLGLLSLHDYLEKAPERFFDDDAFRATLKRLNSLLQSRPAELKSYFKDSGHAIDLAFSAMREINAASWHDESNDGERKFERIFKVSRDMHPAYLRMTEAVLTSLTRVFAHFSRLERGKMPEGLDIWSIWEELKTSDCAVLFRAYRHVVRNGIAHGNVVFRDDELTYTDKKGNFEALWVRAVVQLMDEMVDACNGLVLGFKVFFMTHGEIEIPQEFLFDELRSATQTPWWCVEGCYTSEALGPRTQLNIFALATTTDPGKLQHSVFHLAAHAETLSPGYDRYFVSWRAEGMLPGFAAFEGSRLREFRETSYAVERTPEGLLDAYMLSPLRREKILRYFRRVENIKHAGVAHLLAQRIDASDQKANIRVRVSRAHRNAWGSVIDAKVVIDTSDRKITKEMVRSLAWHIVWEVRRNVRPKEGQSGTVFFLPMAFCLILVFRRDYRIRQFGDYGLGSDLIATIRLHRMSRIRSPDIYGAEIEQSRGLRIAWNRQWLERYASDA